MRDAFAKIAGRLARRPASFGPVADSDAALGELSPSERAIVECALPYTMTGVARLVAIVDAVRHLVARDLAGDFVECGVWRGGSVLAMILTLQELERDDREIHLFDTFEGMTEPTPADVSADESALETWSRAEAAGRRPWEEFFGEQVFGEQDLIRTLEATGYPRKRLHVVRGPVERTIPGAAPESIALLRLDTDWHASTRHELEHLYPRLARGGVLIVDDYGHWAGARQAVDEYFAVTPPRPLLTRIDYTARIAVKD